MGAGQRKKDQHYVYQYSDTTESGLEIFTLPFYSLMCVVYTCVTIFTAFVQLFVPLV